MSSGIFISCINSSSCSSLNSTRGKQQFQQKVSLTATAAVVAVARSTCMFQWKLSVDFVNTVFPFFLSIFKTLFFRRLQIYYFLLNFQTNLLCHCVIFICVICHVTWAMYPIEFVIIINIFYCKIVLHLYTRIITNVNCNDGRRTSSKSQ